MLPFFDEIRELSMPVWKRHIGYATTSTWRGPPSFFLQKAAGPGGKPKWGAGFWSAGRGFGPLGVSAGGQKAGDMPIPMGPKCLHVSTYPSASMHVEDLPELPGNSSIPRGLHSHNL